MGTQDRTKMDYIAEPHRITQQTPFLALPVSLFHLSIARCIRDPNHGLPFRRGLIFCHPLSFPWPPLSHQPFLLSQVVLLRSLSDPSYLPPITTILRSLVRWRKVFQYLSNEAKLPRANPDPTPIGSGRVGSRISR